MTSYIQEEKFRQFNHKILQLPSNEQAELIKQQVKSRFFDITSGLDPDVIEILNEKLVQIRDFFVEQI